MAGDPGDLTDEELDEIAKLPPHPIHGLDNVIPRLVRALRAAREDCAILLRNCVATEILIKEREAAEERAEAAERAVEELKGRLAKYE